MKFLPPILAVVCLSTCLGEFGETSCFEIGRSSKSNPSARTSRETRQLSSGFVATTPNTIVTDKKEPSAPATGNTNTTGCPFAKLMQNPSTSSGPTLWNPVSFLSDLRQKGYLKLLDGWVEEFGPVFDFGPALITVVTGSKNVETAFINGKLPFVVPGIPSNSGFSHDDPKVAGRIRKTLLPVASTKQGARKAIERAAPATQAHMDALALQLGGSTAENINFKQMVAMPLGKIMAGELLFRITGVEEDPARVASLVAEIQSLADKVAVILGADILNNIFTPWKFIEYMLTFQKFREAVESALAVLPSSPCSPMGDLKQVLKAGEISKMDALQAGCSFLLTSTSSIEDVGGGLVWLLANPEYTQLQKACRAEVDAALGGPKQVVRSGDQLEKLHLLKAVLAEIQRCNELTLPNIAVRDFEVNGRTIKRGSFLLVTGKLHEERSKIVGRKAWADNPTKFNPECWLTEQGEFDEHLFGQFSFFGKGAHKCPGRQFGVDGILSAVAAMLSYYDNIRFPTATDMSVVSPTSMAPFRQKVLISADVRM